MPAYAYTGLNPAGKTVKGIETADNVPALKVALKRQGVYLTAVAEGAGHSAGSNRAPQLGWAPARIHLRQVLQSESGPREVPGHEPAWKNNASWGAGR